MKTLVIVVIDPIGDLPESRIKALESMEPDKFLLHAPKKTLDHTVLLGCIGRDVFLLKIIFTNNFDEILCPENQSVIATKDQRLVIFKRLLSREKGIF